MIDFITALGFAPSSWAHIPMSAAFIGSNKAGIVAMSLVAIPVFASIFGGKGRMII
ncbi:MAG: hypothetical protein JEZ04_14680 [Spirochaetales bacterium]|nr:hypothetical protein [Spirochaetales bacterium]